jgi:hypothetical protein
MNDTEGHLQPVAADARYVSKGSSPEDFVTAIVTACGCAPDASA